MALEWTPTGARAYFIVSPTGITGSSGSVTLTNNGADFGPDTPGTTTSGIQEAINAVGTAGGGRVQLLSGVFQILQSVVIQTSNLTVELESGATIQISEGTPYGPFASFVDIPHSFDNLILIVICNASNVRIRGGTLNSTYLQTAMYGNSVSGIVLAANCSNIQIERVRATNFSRWAFWITCFSSLDGTSEGGPVSNVRFTEVDADSCGYFVSNTNLDGGGIKFSNNATSEGANITNVSIDRPNFTNIVLSGIDANFNYGANSEFSIDGGYIQMSNVANKYCYPIYLEDHENSNNSATISSHWKIRGVRINGGGYANIGVYVSTINTQVLILGVTVYDVSASAAIGTAFAIVGSSNSIAIAGADIQMIGNVALGGALGFQVNMVAALVNSSLNRCLLIGNIADDDGFGTMVTGLEVKNASTKTINELHMIGNDFSGISGTGPAVDLSSYLASDATDVSFVSNPGFNPQAATSTTPGSSPAFFPTTPVPYAMDVIVVLGTAPTVTVHLEASAWRAGGNLTLPNTIPQTVHLEPGDQVKVTWSGSGTGPTFYGIPY